MGLFSNFKKGVLFSAAAIMLLSSIGCKRRVRNGDNHGKIIVCFGDSITAGYGVRTGEDYPALLAGRINRAVINAGVSGETTAEGLARIEEDVLRHSPYMVIVEFGGNDFLQKIPFETTIANLEKMIVTIQGAGAIVALADIGGMFVMSKYSNELKRLSSKYETIYISRMLAGVLSNPSMRIDSVHPNAEGYKIVSERVYKKIEPYLEPEN